MPLTTHRKSSRDGGSAQSSPVRSPENLAPQEAQASVNPSPARGSNPSSLEINSRSHFGVSASSGHCGEGASSRPTSSVSWESQGHNERTVISSSHSSYHRPHQHHHHQHGFGWGERDKIILLVDGKRFTINPNLLVKHPNTMLGRMFSSSLDVKPNEHGEYEVAKGVSASLFRAILEYYKLGVVTCPASESVQEMKEACEYLMIPFDEKTIKTNNLGDFLNELSNDGAKHQFEKYVTADILPVMVHCARKGERECQIVILMDDDTIDWDDEHPPSLGEERIQRITSTDLYHYFKYHENRDIAKDVLRDKGLKKIRIGIEGYPTTKEKLRVRQSTGRTEAVYNYVQRPFLRVSWEKEEAKSRHVDFTMVKVKTDIAPDAEAATLVTGPEDNFDY